MTTKLLYSNRSIILNRLGAKLFFPKIKLNVWNQCSPLKKKGMLKISDIWLVHGLENLPAGLLLKQG